MRSHRPRNTAHLTPQSLHLLPVGGAGKSGLVLPITPFYSFNYAATELSILPKKIMKVYLVPMDPRNKMNYNRFIQNNLQV